MPARDTELLLEAAHEAGRIAKRYFGKSPDVQTKPDGQGPVTEADLEINRMLEAELRHARPDYGWLSEETPDTPERLAHDTVFIIDPLDGTRSFIEGGTKFAHSLAVVTKGRPVAAVIHLPMLDLTFSASEEDTPPLKEKPAKALQDAVFLVNKAHLDPVLWRKDVPPIKRDFRPSLAYRMALVAEGRFDGMLSKKPTWEWDVAAGDLICRAAGYSVIDASGNLPKFNTAKAQLNGIIATSKPLADQLLSYL